MIAYRLKRNIVCLSSALLLLFTQQSFGQDSSTPQWPTRTVKIVVPHPAGGSADASTRLVGEELRKIWGVPVIVENKVGASGLLGLRSFVREADDHTLLAAGVVMHVATLTASDPGVDPLEDLKPIAFFYRNLLFLVANSKAPFKTFSELVAYARANPGKVTIGGFSSGSGGNVQVETLNKRLNIDLMYVPYKGAAEVINAVVGGHVMLALQDYNSARAFLENGTVRPLAHIAAQRSEKFPDVPSLSEVGVPDLAVLWWLGLFGPKSMPPSLVTKINKDVSDVMARLKQDGRIDRFGGEPLSATPESMDLQIREDLEKWKSMLKNMDSPK